MNATTNSTAAEKETPAVVYCKEKVWGGWDKGMCPCSRKAVLHGYCKQHHPHTKAERNRKRAEISEAKWQNSPYMQIKRAEARIAELEAQLAEAGKATEGLRRVWAVREKDGAFDETWHTGEYDRGYMPAAYVDTWPNAAIWTERAVAKAHVEQFGGELVEFALAEVPKRDGKEAAE
jgi:hypothetical protein